MNHCHSMEPEFILATSEKTTPHQETSDYLIRDWQEVEASLAQLSKELSMVTDTLSVIATHTLLLVASLRDME